MRLIILSPIKKLFDAEVESVTIPGEKGSFSVWENHAPLITSIDKGEIICRNKSDEETCFVVQGGFAEVKNNMVSICVESVLELDLIEK